MYVDYFIHDNLCVHIHYLCMSDDGLNIEIKDAVKADPTPEAIRKQIFVSFPLEGPEILRNEMEMMADSISIFLISNKIINPSETHTLCKKFLHGLHVSMKRDSSGSTVGDPGNKHDSAAWQPANCEVVISPVWQTEAVRNLYYAKSRPILDGVAGGVGVVDRRLTADSSAVMVQGGAEIIQVLRDFTETEFLQMEEEAFDRLSDKEKWKKIRICVKRNKDLKAQLERDQGLRKGLGSQLLEHQKVVANKKRKTVVEGLPCSNKFAALGDLTEAEGMEESRESDADWPTLPKGKKDDQKVEKAIAPGTGALRKKVAPDFNIKGKRCTLLVAEKEKEDAMLLKNIDPSFAQEEVSADVKASLEADQVEVKVFDVSRLETLRSKSEGRKLPLFIVRAESKETMRNIMALKRICYSVPKWENMRKQPVTQ